MALPPPSRRRRRCHGPDATLAGPDADVDRHSCYSSLGHGPDTKGMTDGISQLRTIERIEMKLPHPVILQSLYLLDGHTRSDHPAGIGVVIESLEPLT